MRAVRRYFVAGFFALIPLGLSVAIVWWFVRLVDGTFSPVVDAALGWHFPGLGLVAAVLTILVAGIVASHVVGGRFIEAVEELLSHIPVFKGVYATVKQMTEAFSPHNKTSFKSVVIVEYPRPGAYSLGFATSETTLELKGSSKDLVAVYVPTNHVYFGDMVLVPREHVHATEIGVQQGLQIVLSGGSALPERIGAPKMR